MAHKKGVGSSKNGRESESKRLGVKIFGGQFAKAGNIRVRTWVWVRITLCSRFAMVSLLSAKNATTSRTYPSSR